MGVHRISKNRIVTCLVVLLMAVFIPIASSASVVVDFTDAAGYGTSRDNVMIENIRVDQEITNPFDPTRPSIVTANYNVTFRFDPATLHLIPSVVAPIDDTTTCSSLQVNVSDAYTGAPISGAAVTISGSTVYSDYTGIAYFSGLTSGTAQISATASGYVDSSRQATLSCDISNSVGLALSATSGSGSVAANEFRVVLSWGENPYDLDSHLTGPDAYSTGLTTDTTNRFHVYYGNPTEDVASLDVDDTSSYGPETITVTPSGSSTLRPGLYRYSVYHYYGAETISTSNASVSLQMGTSRSRTFSPPAGASGSGDTWTVFELYVDSQGLMTVYEINTLTQPGGSGSVQSTSTGYGSVENGVDFTRLPLK